MGRQLAQLFLENVTLVLKELVNGLLRMYGVEDVSCKSDNHIERLIKEMGLDSQLELGDVLSCNTFVIEFEQLFSDQKWVNLVELNGEDHLTISVEFFKHLCIAIFEAVEQYFNLLENVFLWFRRINPLGEVVEELLLKKFPVLLSSKIRVDLAHTSRIRLAKTLFHRAPVKIENKERRKVCQFTWQSNYISVLEIKFPQLLALRDLNRHFS